MRIDIRFIPKSEMRPGIDGWGDWYWVKDTLHIRSLSDEPECDPFLVAFHELAEAWLCRDKGISVEDVDAFDAAFVAPDDDPDAEPGDHPDSPYRVQHRQAMMIENLMALFLGITDYGVMR
jgi:hypothetical protein